VVSSRRLRASWRADDWMKGRQALTKEAFSEPAAVSLSPFRQPGNHAAGCSS